MRCALVIETIMSANIIRIVLVPQCTPRNLCLIVGIESLPSALRLPTVRSGAA
jgi:hypothetical protein